MFFELRLYRIKNGYMEKFTKIMDEMIIPFQTEMGMDIKGSFITKDEENLFIWIRRFKDENEKQRLYDRVYGSEYWEKTIRPAMAHMIDKENSKVHLMVPSENSGIK